MLVWYKKIKRGLNNKGFTLIELLAIIIVLAIIMLISIPAVLDAMEGAKRKTFSQYADKILSTSRNQIITDDIDFDNLSSCVVYSIKKDLGLANTGDYDGYVLFSDKFSYNSESDLDGFIIVLWNNDYGAIRVIGEDTSQILEENIMKYDEFIYYIKSLGFDEPNIQFMFSYLSKYSVTGCSLDNSNPDLIPDVDKEAIITNGRFAQSTLKSIIGCDYSSSTCENHYKFKKYQGKKPVKNRDSVITTDESLYPVYVWVDGDVIYYYSEASKIYVINGEYIFAYLPFESIDLSGMLFNKTEVTYYMFANCNPLEYVTFGSGDMSNNKNTDYMFKDCTLLKKIYVPEDWNISYDNSDYYGYNDYYNDYYVYGMFTNCKSLCGSVRFDQYFNDKSRAKLIGYLTLIGHDNSACNIILK